MAAYLLYAGLHQVRGKHVPEKPRSNLALKAEKSTRFLPKQVHQSVDGGDVPGSSGPGDGGSVPFPRMDNDHGDDAQNDRTDRRDQVVANRSDSDASGQGQVERPDGGNQRRDYERQDERLQHSQEDVPYEINVKYVPRTPTVVLGSPEDEAQDNSAHNPANGE